ncbi:MAG: hypothetical protein AAFY02_13685 [Pseudomonadota bacterium]
MERNGTQTEVQDRSDRGGLLWAVSWLCSKIPTPERLAAYYLREVERPSKSGSR